MATAPFPRPRRIVEANQTAPLPGGSGATEPGVDVQVDELEPVSMFGGILTRATIATHTSIPTKNEGTAVKLDPIPGSGVTLPGGAHIFYLDLAPQSETPTHRTESVDYVIVLKGTLTAVTPAKAFGVADGKGNFEEQETVAREGDVVVQRGGMHRLANRTDEWIRLVGIVLSATNGEVRVGEESQPLTERWIQ